MSNPLNITTASFGGLREVATSPLWQWDYGQILKIKGLDLPQAFEVHFSNSRKSGETITQIGTDGQVTIPDMYLTSGADIYCFIFLHDGLTDGETEYVIKIPVRERPEPSDIEPTPEQQDVITEAIAALNQAVEESETNVEHYPCIIEGYWHVWDAQTEAFISTGVEAQGEKGDGGLCIFLDRTGSPIPTDADKHLPASATVTCGVYCFKGGERIDPENVTASAFQYKSGQYSASLPATITHNTAEAAQWRVTYNLNASNNITLIGDSGSQLIKVTVDGEVHKIYYPWFAAKQGETGEGGLNIDLTMDAIIIPTDPDRMPDSEYRATIDITADRDGEVVGIETVSATIVSMEYVDGQGVVHRTGVVPSISAMHDSTLDIDIKYTVKYKFKYDPYYFVADSGTVTITIRIGSKNYTRIIPWTLSKQGEAGADAVNVFLKDPVTLIPTDSDGFIPAQKVITTTVYAFKGGEPCTITSVTATPVTILIDATHIQAVNAVVTVYDTYATVTYTIPKDTGIHNGRQIPTITTVIDGESYVNAMCIASARQGETGTTPDLTIGTVQTLPAGSQATASITGTEEEPVLNLGLPKGDAGDVQDVQVNGTSVVTDGVANVPIATSTVFGVVSPMGLAYGISNADGSLSIAKATNNEIKSGDGLYKPIVTSNQDRAVFYGLAKSAGSDEKNSALAVGQYTEDAKSAISTMLNAPVTVSGTTPTITAKSGIQYICGEVATLDITLPDSGIVDVVFTSGSTPTVLTVTPPTGQTVRWANGFDATSLEADTVYEINILNGLGVAQTWSTS